MRIAIGRIIQAVQDESEIDVDSIFNEAFAQAIDDINSTDTVYEEELEKARVPRYSSLATTLLYSFAIFVYYGACSALGIFLRGGFRGG